MSITVLTDIGRTMLAGFASGGAAYASAKIVVGDGNGATYLPNAAQTTLVHEVWRGVATVALAEDKVIFQASVPANIGGFTVREVGVLLGDVGAESLFIVSQHPTTEKLAAPANGAGLLPIAITFNASNSQIGAFPVGLSDNAILDLTRVPHLSVDDLVTVAPADPDDGLMVAIGAGAAGIFAGKAGYLAERVAGAWLYKLPAARTAIRVPAGNWYQRVGADWTALNFTGVVPWDAVADKPATFAPSAHHHDDLYHAKLVADGRFVLKAGDTMTGDLVVPNANVTSKVLLNGSAGTAKQILTSDGPSSPALWRNLADLLTIAPNTSNAENYVWDELSNGLYWLDVEYNSAVPATTGVPAMLPRASGADLIRNFKIFEYTTTSGLVDLPLYGKLQNTKYAIKQLITIADGRMRTDTYPGLNGVSTSDWRAFIPEPTTFQRNISSIPTFTVGVRTTSFAVTGLSVRAAVGRAMWVASTINGADNYVEGIVSRTSTAITNLTAKLARVI